MNSARTWILAAVLLAPICMFGKPARADTVSVSAAVSLREVLTEIAGIYHTASSDTIDLNFGASGTLAAQIKQGAPVDLFISAGAKPVDDLIAAKIADQSTRCSIAGNSLVLIVPKDFDSPPTRFEDLRDARFRHIAIGEPQVVPAGEYAMQTLKSLRLDKPLHDRLVFGENVRQVLIYVTRREAEAGIVYATDAIAAANDVKVAATADASTHDPIEYPALLISQSPHRAAAEKFLKFLTGDSAQKSLVSHGFQRPAMASDAPSTRPATQN